MGVENPYDGIIDDNFDDDINTMGLVDDIILAIIKVPLVNFVVDDLAICNQAVFMVQRRHYNNVTKIRIV